MPSVVHGPGTREGMAAELPPRPTSLWEFLLEHAEQLNDHELRRVLMLVLRAVVGLRLEDLGRAFDVHKGHVSREIDRARGELSETLSDSNLLPVPPRRSRNRDVQLWVYLTAAEAAEIRERAKTNANSVSEEIRRKLGIPDAVETAEICAETPPEASGE